MKSSKKDTVIAIFLSLLIHFLAVALCYFCYMRTIVPEEDSGLLISYADISVVEDIDEYQQQEQIAMSSDLKPMDTEAEDLVTQESAETAHIPTSEVQTENAADNESRERPARNNPEAESLERLEREKKEKERLEREERQRQEKAIDDRVKDVFNKSKEQQRQQTQTPPVREKKEEPERTELIPESSDNVLGAFNLSGRGLYGGKQLVRPSNDWNEPGEIVLNITVDPDGKVINATIAPKTTVVNLDQKLKAIAAAKMNRFVKIRGTDNQSGTITYRYIYRNK